MNLFVPMAVYYNNNFSDSTGDTEMSRQQYLVVTLVHAVAVEWPFQFALPTVCRDN